MINCIAIDDEPLALKQIVSYVGKTPYLNLLEQFDNAISALEYLQSHKVDLMFVDINMPDLSGMDFVKSLNNAPEVIFTTAYSEYAVEGFKVSALDYLLKPISYADFSRASSKALNHFNLLQSKSEPESSKAEFLFIKSEHRHIKIKISDIIYLESMRDYVRIHRKNAKPVMTLSSLKKMEESLAGGNFMRVHRSYIINSTQISGIERNRLLFEPDIAIPVSEQYQSEIKKLVDKNTLE